LTEEWKDGRVLRLNILVNAANMAYYEKLGVKETPMFILFDGRGKEIKRWAGAAPGTHELADLND
jgi:thioredoxin-related protein